MRFRKRYAILILCTNPTLSKAPIFPLKCVPMRLPVIFSSASSIYWRIGIQIFAIRSFGHTPGQLPGYISVSSDSSCCTNYCYFGCLPTKYLSFKYHCRELYFRGCSYSYYHYCFEGPISHTKARNSRDSVFPFRETIPTDSKMPKFLEKLKLLAFSSHSSPWSAYSSQKSLRLHLRL